MSFFKIFETVKKRKKIRVYYALFFNIMLQINHKFTFNNLAIPGQYGHYFLKYKNRWSSLPT